MSKEVIDHRLKTVEMVEKLHKTIYNQDQKISDLEAKLAESEKDRLMWQEMYKSADKQNKEICETDIYPLQEENEQLEQQLADKEAEIEELNHKLNVEQPCLLMNYQDMVEKLKARIEQDNQDKISFCIEKLEKVKGKIQHNILFVDYDDYLDVIEEIDNQIKQLKEKDNG